jgi:hypothetical protein
LKVAIGEESWLKFEQGMLSLKSIDIQIIETFILEKTYYKNGTNEDVICTICKVQEVLGLISKRSKLVLKPESISVTLRAINSQNNGGLLDYVGIATDITKSR